MKILTFAASNSRQSINKRLASYAAGLLPQAAVRVLDLNDHEMPLYSEDREREGGVPQAAHDFRRAIADADALVISFAEHNGSYSAAYKNILDWCSRIDRGVYQDKPVVLLSTSPGSGGAANVLKVATESMPHFAARVVASISVPKFHDHFDLDSNTLVNKQIHEQIEQAMQQLASA